MTQTTSTSNSIVVPDIAFLIENAKKNPPEPVLEGLLNEGEIAGLHGPQEAFKTIFTLQLAESLATGKPFLGHWQVPEPRSTYYFEDEMSNSALGRRLGEMFRRESPPNGIRFADEKRLKEFKRAPNLATKFHLLSSWVHADVPDLLLEIRRTDKRVNQAELSVTKYRHGMKPDDLTLWFDTGDFRLIAIHPVMHLLKNGPLSREALLSLLEKRFGVSQRKGDELIEEQAKFLNRDMEGHQRVFAINSTAAKSADTYESFWLRKGPL